MQVKVADPGDVIIARVALAGWSIVERGPDHPTWDKTYILYDRAGLRWSAPYSSRLAAARAALIAMGDWNE